MNNIKKFDLLVNESGIKDRTAKINYNDISKDLLLTNLISECELDQFKNKCIENDSILITHLLCWNIAKTIKGRRHLWIELLTQVLLDSGINSFTIPADHLSVFNTSSINHLFYLLDDYGWSKITIDTVKAGPVQYSLLIFKR